MLAEDLRGGVDEEGHEEQHHGAQKQGAIERAEVGRLGQFDGDVGGQGAHAGKDIEVGDRGVAGGHDDDHGFPHRPAQTDHDGGEDAGRSGGQHDPDGGLPPAGAQSQRSRAKGFGDIAEGILGDGEDDGDDGEAHDKTDHERIALLEAQSGDRGVPEPEIGDAHAGLGIGHHEEHPFDHRSALPADPGKQQQQRREDDKLVPGLNPTTVTARQIAPEPADQQGPERDRDDGQQHRRNPVADNGGQPEGGEETEDHRRQGGHDFHGGFDHAFDGRLEELRGVDRGEHGDGQSEQHGIERALEGPDDQRNE